MIQLTKDVNIFEFPQWEILKKDALFDNLKTEDSEYFLKESSDSYFNLQLFRENSKKYYDLNEAEALFIQGFNICIVFILIYLNRIRSEQNLVWTYSFSTRFSIVNDPILERSDWKGKYRIL